MADFDGSLPDFGTVPAVIRWRKCEERVSALILQLGLSILVWTAVRKGGKWLWLFPAAILLHFLVDACAVVISKNASMAFTEVVIFAMALAVGAMGFLLARKLDGETAPAIVSSRP